MMFMAKCKSAAVLGLFFLTLGAVGLSVATGSDRVDNKLTLAEFEKIHRELKFAKKGIWSIPWHVSLSEARAQAAREKKPVFLAYGSGTILSTC